MGFCQTEKKDIGLENWFSYWWLPAKWAQYNNSKSRRRLKDKRAFQ